MDRARQKTRVAFYSVLVGVLLSGLKLLVGIATGSLGILSEALHSLLDLGAALITFFAVRVSSRPPDREHPYGHGKVENLSALAEAAILLGTCVWIVDEALRRLWGKEIHVEANHWAFLVMGVSVALDVAIAVVLRRAARKFSSQALEADALHYASDILSSSVVIAGLIGVRLGIPALDPVAALGVALLVAVASIRLGRRAVEELLDRAPKGLAEEIKAKLETLERVAGIERVRVRRSGSSTFIDVVASTSRLRPLDETHEISEKIEEEVRALVPESDVLVHLEPSSDGESMLETVGAVALGCCPEVKGVHDIRSYRDEESGRYFLSLHVVLEPSHSLEQARDITDRLEAAIRGKLPQIETIETHVEAAGSVGDGRKSRPPEDKLEMLKKAFAGDDRILEVHDVFLHESAKGLMATCHVIVQEDIPLEEAHRAATAVENKLRELFPEIVEVISRTEPGTQKTN